LHGAKLALLRALSYQGDIMIKKQESANVLVRLPPALKAWLVDEAAKNCASHNSEIVRCVRERMERELANAALARAKERAIAAVAAAD
jgi:hypothetical protein